MSTMFNMLCSGKFYHDENVARQIQSTLNSHPIGQLMDATPCIVFDDEGWDIYKRNMAKRAKERKKEKSTAAPKSNTKPLLVRSNNRDNTFERIQLDSTKKVVRICKSSYEIIKYGNFDEIKKTYIKIEADRIYSILTGECDSNDYFWTQ